ncbi:MAG TPA: response regulator [Chloroflexota bacterium]
MPRILVVDDEPQILRSLRTSLCSRGYDVVTARHAEEALDALSRDPFDVVILDLGLPDADGLNVCRQVREWSQVPIIVLSVRDSERDKVTALDLGADDYLTKPFGIEELLARIRAALRRASNGAQPPAVFVAGHLTVDFAARVVTRQGEEVHLTPTEYELLKYLILNAGKVVTHRNLLQAVWGPAYSEETSYLRVFIAQLRRKIEPDPARPQYIVTEPGVGYRFRVPT